MKGKNQQPNRVNGAPAENGTEVVTVLTPEQAAAKQTEPTAEAVAEEVRADTPAPYVPPKARTIDERLGAFQSLKNLTEKRERIFAKHERLARMRQANEADAVQISIQANGGLALEIQHTSLIDEVLDVMAIRLSEALASVEAEILSLEV